MQLSEASENMYMNTSINEMKPYIFPEKGLCKRKMIFIH